jgi:hypothetical protein
MAGFYTIKGPDVRVNRGNYGQSIVTCNAGDMATGGGFTTPLTVSGVTVTESAPVEGDPASWRVLVVNRNSSNSINFNAYVVCVDVTP